MRTNSTSSNLAWLDLVRIISILLVMYGHFASVGGNALSIPGIISSETVLPLMDGPKHVALHFDILLLTAFSAESAILGVALFFMVTGYLMPMMMERYSRRDFLINRFFRIFPTLVVATLLIGGYLWLTQGITFSTSSYFASWSLTYLYFGVAPITGVLWTLVIEVIFYLLSALTGRFSIAKHLMLQGALLAFLLYGAAHSAPAGSLVKVAANHTVYFLYIGIGVAFYLAEQESLLSRKIALVFNSLVISYVGFQFHKQSMGSAGTYENLGTHIAACAIFGGMMALHKMRILFKIPSAATWFADLVYPIYLFHAAIGLSTMAVARTLSNHYVFVMASAIVSTVALSWLVHQLVEKPGLRLGRGLTSSAARPKSASQPLKPAQ